VLPKREIHCCGLGDRQRVAPCQVGAESLGDAPKHVPFVRGVGRFVLGEGICDAVAKRSGRDDAKLIGALVDEDLVTIAPLARLKEDHFEDLVAGPAAETLDDGEASTIACAIETKALALIDERKAIASCARKHPSLIIGRTVDVFAHDAVERALGHAALADAVFSTLQNARMRVSPHHEKWVVDLIGNARTRDCPSLPGRLRVGRAATISI
jgi:predicted nucleic acid-binding protein